MAALTGKPYLSFHEDSVHIGWGATYRLPTYPLAPKRWLSVGRRSNYLPTSQAYQGSGLPYNEKTRNAGKTSALGRSVHPRSSDATGHGGENVLAV